MVDSGALDGLRVLDLSRITAGGRTTQILADFGADVVKLESPSSPDPFRHWTMVTGSGADDGATVDDLSSTPFRTVGRNKRSLGVDLKAPQAREIVRRLVAQSDVVIENFRRGVLERLGLTFEQLRAWNPRIVLLSLSSQGETGPTASYASYGVTLEALGGLMAVTGYEGGAPTWTTSKLNYPDQAVSLIAPGLAVWGVMHARATGRGIHIDLAQRELVTSLLGDLIVDYALTEEVPVPHGNRNPGAVDFCVRCAGENHWVAVSLRGDDDWARLAAILDEHGLADDELQRSLGERLAARDRFEAARWLHAAGIAAAPVLAGYETQEQFPEFFVSVPGPDRAENQFGWPFTIDVEGAATIRAGAAHIGQHTGEILAELGFSADEVESLSDESVVFGAAFAREGSE